MAARARGLAVSRALAIDDRNGYFVGFDDIVPHPHGEKDVRGHVLRVAGFGGNGGIDARGAEAERSVDGVVVTVYEVMNNAGMMRVRGKNLFEERCGTHVGGEVAALFGGAQDSEGVEGGGVHVIGEIFVELSHSSDVELVTVVFGSFAVE